MPHQAALPAARSRHHYRILMVLVIAALGVVLAPAVSAQAEREDDDRQWPREFKLDDGGSLLLFQPQAERWDDYRTIEVLVAAVVTLPRGPELIGALEIRIETETHHDDRMVTLRDPEFTKINFPGASEADARAAEKVVRKAFPSKSVAISLDRIFANLERRETITSDVQVRSDPPKIILSEKDAILVRIHGEPVYEEIPSTGVSIIVNTISDLFRYDETGQYYLMRGKHWLEAPSLEGPWTPNRLLPEGFFRMPDNDRLREVRRGVRGRSPDALRHPPDVYVVDEPTELIVMYGRPKFEKIKGTNLSFVTNSESDIFRYEPDRLYYALFSGRWFRTPGSGAPLEFCTHDLPEDFAQIPPDHAMGRVLASVPGTDSARRAVIASQIPHTAVVNRLDASFDVSYTGTEPEFESIEGCAV
ncbi:MAG: hypothetical protein ACYTGP_05285 [Planctomycetota bacterium]|jgi:hypothetical protein